MVRPIRRFVLLVDDQQGWIDEGGVLIDARLGTDNLDYYVAAVGTEERDLGFGVGDRVVLADPNAGRKVRLDGAAYRLVRTSDIIAVMENDNGKC